MPVSHTLAADHAPAQYLSICTQHWLSHCAFMLPKQRQRMSLILHPYAVMLLLLQMLLGLPSCSSIMRHSLAELI